MGEKKKIDCYKRYNIKNLILLFFTFSSIGWIWEVMIHIVEDGVFINRGVLFGPWLPIYGTGIVLLFLKKYLDKPVIMFLIIMLLTSLVEYFTSWILEIYWDIRWWDYTGYFLNINGRICLEGTIIFGIGGCLAVYYIAPILSEYYEKISNSILNLICIILCGLFIFDMIYSFKKPNTGEGITDYEQWSMETSIIKLI